MKSAMQAELTRLIDDLDIAIRRAVENPLLLADTSFETLGSTSANLLAIVEHWTSTTTRGPAEVSRQTLLQDPLFPGTSMEIDRDQCRTLVWEVRTRVGRLQRLLDAAARFYSNCFTSNQSEGLAYGVLGEWCETSNPSCLALDC